MPGEYHDNEPATLPARCFSGAVIEMSHWVEILGYVASVLVAVSLTMSSLARLRALNLLGAIAFAVYGGMVGAYPVLAVNGFIAVVNIVYLRRMQPGRSEAFELLAIRSLENRYFQRFLEFHAEDIRTFFPDFRAEDLGESHIVFILRDMSPVGVVICEDGDDQSLSVRLDYVIPAYRDFRCAQYFYRSWAEVIQCSGACRFVATGGMDKHRAYLRRMGFVPDESLGQDSFVRTT
jgi:Bacterial inner membrane protein